MNRCSTLYIHKCKENFQIIKTCFKKTLILDLLLFDVYKRFIGRQILKKELKCLVEFGIMNRCSTLYTQVQRKLPDH